MLIASAAPRILWELHGRLAAPYPDFNRTHIQLVGKPHGEPHDIAIEAPQRRLRSEPEFHGRGGNSFYRVVDRRDHDALHSIGALIPRAQQTGTDDAWIVARHVGYE